MSEPQTVPANCTKMEEPAQMCHLKEIFELTVQDHKHAWLWPGEIVLPSVGDLLAGSICPVGSKSLSDGPTKSLGPDNSVRTDGTVEIGGT